jgi:glycolate oxidase
VTKNHLLGLEAVLADGSVVQTGDLAPAEAFGPDPTGLFCGSEGTLGIVTKALVKLTQLPEGVRTGMAVFSSLEDAAAAVSAVIARGIVPTTLEIMDQTMIRAVDDFLNLGFPRDAEALLLIEVDGFEIELDRQMDLIVDVCRSKGAGDVTSAQNPADRDRLWLARRSGNGALGRIKPTAMVQDVTVPRHRLPELLRSVSDIGRKHGVIIAQLAHAGDGNGHPHLLFDPDDADERRRVDEASRDIFQLALDLGGTLTGEHGVGLEKRAFMPMQFSHNDLECMAGLKKALDPDHRLNPGKLLPQEYFNA